MGQPLYPYYLLCLVNHSTRQFELRVEDDGDWVGSKHNLCGYIPWMAVQLTKLDAGLTKPFYANEMWRAAMADPSNLEQHVVAVIDASDIKSARMLARPHRATLKAFYKALGYTPFASETEVSVNDPQLEDHPIAVANRKSWTRA